MASVQPSCMLALHRDPGSQCGCQISISLTLLAQHNLGDNPYQQAGDLFRLMTADEQERLTSNIANALRSVPAEIRQRQLAHFEWADPHYGELVAGKLDRADR